MADITKCRVDQCDFKERCWRYLAPASEHNQAWFLPQPNKTGIFCELFWDVSDAKNRRARRTAR